MLSLILTWDYTSIPASLATLAHLSDTPYQHHGMGFKGEVPPPPPVEVAVALSCGTNTSTVIHSRYAHDHYHLVPVIMPWE